MAITFLTPQQLTALGYECPKQNETHQLLELLDLEQKYQAKGQLLGYQKMYALDRIIQNIAYWQGYIPTQKFKIHTQYFKQDSAKGTVFLLHGYLEHSGIYQPLIQEVLQQGFDVLIFDLPGHGLSEGDIANIDDFDDYQQVLLCVYQHMQAQLVQPCVAIGQSTGCAIAMHHILQYAEQRQAPLFRQVLLLSPLIRPAMSSWWHNSVGLGIVKRVKQRVARPFRRNNHNPEFLRFVRLHDPLQAKELGMEWILAMSKWMEQMDCYPSCRIPVWLAQGALDKTVDWRYNVEFVRKKFRLQAFLFLEEGSHQLVNEVASIRLPLTGFIASFLNIDYQTDYYRTEYYQ